MKHTPYTLQLQQRANIQWISPNLVKTLLFIQSGWRIITSKTKEEKLPGTEAEIIRKIHELRYNEQHSYVTTGGHFSQLYVRNLGIFLNSLLDPRIPCTKEDWLQRQKIALRTVALDLEVFAQAKKTYTTIVHLGGNRYSAINIYTHPSDSLFGILYTLCALSDEHFIASLFPAETVSSHRLSTHEAAQTLVEIYKKTLRDLLKQYKADTIDNQTGLIKRNITLASARDGLKRQSAFYDNVIQWSTFLLADRLGIFYTSQKDLQVWKTRIINTFWDEQAGIFMDDLSPEAKEEKRFCADAFIVVSTGFLNVQHKQDKEKIKKLIAYVKKHRLDKPFPLRYSKTNHIDRLYWPVRIAAPEYVGKTIWSHWGMEYIKTLILLGEKKYCEDAKRHLQAYKQMIETYGGYPELYDEQGKLYQTPLYKSVLHNSWVINYEQAKMMGKSTKK